MRLTKSDKELLLTVLQSYVFTEQMKIWNDEAAKQRRIAKVVDLTNRIYYDLIGGTK